MTTILGILGLALFLSVALTLLMMRVARGFGILDKPDDTRHLHLRPVPKLGGVAVFVAFMVPVFLLTHLGKITFLSEPVLDAFPKVAGLFLGSLVVLIVGLVDDVLDLRPRWKLVWQVIGAGVAYRAGFTITALSLPFAGSLELGPLAMPVTIMWFLICMNAVNFLDGHDGLAAGACLFVSLTVMLVSITNHNSLGALLMASFSGAVLGFLFFNFPPAKIFLGDSGSLVLGFLVAGLSLVGATMKAETAFALLVPVVAMGLPFFDTLYAIMRRVYARMPVSMGDRGHVHHILSRLGYSQRSVVLLLYGVTMVLCLLAFFVTVTRNEVVLLVIVGLAATAFVAMRVFSGVTPTRMVGRYLGDRAFRQRVLKARLVFQNNVDQIRAASSVDQVWDVCRNVLHDVGVECARLTYDKESDREVLPWRDACTRQDAHFGGWRLSIPFRGENEVSGELQVVLRESEHSLAAMPEFIGLLESMRAMMQEQVARLPRKSGRS